MSEQRRALLRVLESADKPLGPKEITERLEESGTQMKYGAVREMCSRMVNDGQIRNLGRGQYVAPGSEEAGPDNADKLT